MKNKTEKQYRYSVKWVQEHQADVYATSTEEAKTLIKGDVDRACDTFQDGAAEGLHAMVFCKNLEIQRIMKRGN